MIATVQHRDLEWAIGERFDAVAAARRDQIAIRTPRVALTYGELKARADAIGRHIFERVAGRANAPVVTYLPQGAAAIAAELGVLKAGACYVPADVRAAGARLHEIVVHAGASLVLADRHTSAAARSSVGDGCAVIDVADAVADPCRRNLPEVSPDSLAYIYYTSGSTGAPKGVPDTHRNVMHNVLRYTRSLGLSGDDRISLLQPPWFSGAVSSTYCALLNGAALFPYDLREDGPADLGNWLVDQAITVFHSVPAIFRSLVAGRREYPAMRIIRLEGDRALAQDARLFKAHFERGCRLVNGLGTTETGIVRQFFVDHDTPIDEGALPIGYAVEDVECFVADRNGNPLDTGNVGEIVVQSAYLAQGYWRDPKMTASRFSSIDGTRSRRYRTGDLGRMRADGCLEYHGRADAQLRIRGMSVDRMQIEQALLRIPDVRDAAVVAIDDGRRDVWLCAVVVGCTAVTPTRLRDALRGMLPDHAMPSSFVLVDALPLTPLGKVDRAAICALARDHVSNDPAPNAAPENAVEGAIAGIWMTVLGAKSVRTDVAFLDLGGDSLAAMQVLARIRDDLGVCVSPADFFGLSTVAQQARFIEDAMQRSLCRAHIVAVTT